MTDNILQSNNMAQDFVDATVEALGAMAGLDVTLHDIEEVNGDFVDSPGTADKNMTSVLGFSGDCSGRMLVTMSRELAMAAVGGMLGVEFSDINMDVPDGVGELANMIAGGAKTKLQKRGIDFEFSLADTVIGTNYNDVTPVPASRTRLDFQTNSGDFFIEVYLKKE